MLNFHPYFYLAGDTSRKVQVEGPSQWVHHVGGFVL
jgi:hypothetical protein